MSTVIPGCEAAVAFLSVESSLWLLFIDALRAGTQIRSTQTPSEPELSVPGTPELSMPAAGAALN